ncbi:MAG TPA: hypothetical protein VNA30_08640, partial [Mycobacteriales bacterium]|nr:hypothetical protein [Mycobacteriales bacterium]
MLVLLALLMPLVLAGPAQAGRTLTIRITAQGPVPSTLTAAAGDMIRFRNDDPTFPHAARSASANWNFRTGLLAPGSVYTVPEVLSRPGTYSYAGDGLDTFTGKVIIPGKAKPAPSSRPSSPSPEPSPGSSSEPPDSPSPTPTPDSLSSSPSPGGSTPTATADASVQPPNVAPSSPAPRAEPRMSTGPQAIIGGRLPQDPTNRRYGL